MTATALDLRALGFPTRACAHCGWRFFTTHGRDRHSRSCGVLRERGLAVAALNNARRVRCEECGQVSTPSGIGLHQRSSGHSGRTEQT